jgi:hypothetical protein
MHGCGNNVEPIIAINNFPSADFPSADFLSPDFLLGDFPNRRLPSSRLQQRLRNGGIEASHGCTTRPISRLTNRPCFGGSGQRLFVSVGTRTYISGSS